MKVRKLGKLAAISVISFMVVTGCVNSSNNAVSTDNATGEIISVYIEKGTAIKGIDPVAYFKKSKPVKGQESFSFEWKGANWLFSSAENRDLFASNPEKYAPQYGGFCAWAVGQGNLVSIDPEAWKIVDGKLYLNYNKQVQKTWEEDIPGNIAKANANWPAILNQ